MGELRKIVSEGNRAIIFYLIQRTDVSEWDLACDIDKNYTLVWTSERYTEPTTKQLEDAKKALEG